MENDRTTPIRNLSSLSPEATPSKPPTITALSPHERADLHRRFEVLDFELKRLEVSLSGFSDYGCTYSAAAGEDTLVYSLPACFIEVADHLRMEGMDALYNGSDLTAKVTVQLVEALLNTALAPENASLAAEALDETIAFTLDSVEVPITRKTKLGNP